MNATLTIDGDFSFGGSRLPHIVIRSTHVASCMGPVCMDDKQVVANHILPSAPSLHWPSDVRLWESSSNTLKVQRVTFVDSFWLGALEDYGWDWKGVKIYLGTKMHKTVELKVLPCLIWYRQHFPSLKHKLCPMLLLLLLMLFTL